MSKIAWNTWKLETWNPLRQAPGATDPSHSVLGLLWVAAKVVEICTYWWTDIDIWLGSLENLQITAVTLHQKMFDHVWSNWRTWLKFECDQQMRSVVPPFFFPHGFRFIAIFCFKWTKSRWTWSDRDLKQLYQPSSLVVCFFVRNPFE